MDSDERDLRDMGDHKENQPWWNDGDKMGGLAASILMVGLAGGLTIVILAIALKIALWLLQ